MESRERERERERTWRKMAEEICSVAGEASAPVCGSVLGLIKNHALWRTQSLDTTAYS
jgi:hypothetical protein